MNRRIRLTITALLCALVATAGGVRAAGLGSKAHGPVVVQYWLNLCWQPAQTDFRHLVAAFNSSHPGIQIQPTCFSNASVLQPRLLAAIHQHRPPALSQTDAFAVASYVDLGAVQDLTPYVHGKTGLSAAAID